MQSIRASVLRQTTRPTAPRTSLSRALTRRNASGSSLPPTPAAPLSTPPPKKAKSATALFYRELVPSMLHCLALGSIVYYALELLHHTLDKELVVDELEDKVRGLELELDGLRAQGARSGTQGKAWWRFW